MKAIIYIVCERFDPTWGKRWSDYVNWSGLTQLTEVISLDGMLCPTVYPVPCDEDWEHCVDEDHLLDFYRDLEYLLSRVGDPGPFNVLAVQQEPETAPLVLPPEPGFVFKGFDLMDEDCGNSALTNCRGFPEAFRNPELNRFGLLDGFSRAREVQAQLREKYPAERHARCHVWAIWRREDSGGGARAGTDAMESPHPLP